MRTSEHSTTCPFCNITHPAATDPVGNAIPSNGSFALCIDCGEWCIYDDTVPQGMRKLTPDEYEMIATNPIAVKLRKYWAEGKEMTPEREIALGLFKRLKAGKLQKIGAEEIKAASKKHRRWPTTPIQQETFLNSVTRQVVEMAV